MNGFLNPHVSAGHTHTHTHTHTHNYVHTSRTPRVHGRSRPQPPGSLDLMCSCRDSSRLSGAFRRFIEDNDRICLQTRRPQCRCPPLPAVAAPASPRTVPPSPGPGRFPCPCRRCVPSPRSPPRSPRGSPSPCPMLQPRLFPG